MKNTLSDLNDHLFAQLERLGDEELDTEAVQKEIERSIAICNVSKSIIENANTVINATKLKNSLYSEDKMPKMLDI